MSIIKKYAFYQNYVGHDLNLNLDTTHLSDQYFQPFKVQHLDQNQFMENLVDVIYY